MDFDRMRGDWAAIRLMVRQQWNRLTDEDLEAIDGDREALLNVLEQRYDSPRDRLEQQVSDFEGLLGGRDEDEAELVGASAGNGGDSGRAGNSPVTGADQGSQGRQLYEQDSIPGNQQNDKQQAQQGNGANAPPSQGHKRLAEEGAGAGSMSNKQPAEQQGKKDAGRIDRDSKSGSRSLEQADGSAQAGKRSTEQADDAAPADKRSAEQSDGASKSDRQPQGGQKGKQPTVPPSWQRQSERRPQQPNR